MYYIFKKIIFVFLLWILASNGETIAQTYTMASGTISTCSGTFYDPGGTSNYGNNLNITETFCSNAGNCIRISFTSFNTQAGNDILTIYDGPSTASAVIGSYSGNTSPGVVISSSGCLTFKFVTNGSNVKAGWAATISCVSCGNIYLMNNNTAVNTCNGLFYDDGGLAGNYANNLNFTKTFCSSPAGSCIQILFTAFNLKANDILTFYNGSTVASPLIGAYTGTTLPPTILSSTGCLTVNFTTNGSSVGSGWEAVVSCEPCPTPPGGSATYTHPTVGLQNAYVGTNMVATCSGTYTDNGGVGGNYSANINDVYRTFCPNQAGKCMRATFWSLDIEGPFGGFYTDYLEILNGPTQNSPQFGTGSIWYGTATTYQACMNAGLGPYVSTDQSGCLTFIFNSDGSVNQAGWVATLDCVPCSNGPNGTDNSDCITPTAICTNQSFTDASTGPGIVSDGGGGCVLAENFSNWYRILINTSGTLGLNIVPNNVNDDYDFALYQSTTCAGLGAPVRCSYASNTGTTGMDNALNLSTNTAICGTPNNGSDISEDVCGNAWVNTVPVIAGQAYYLLVNKWSPGGSGFTLNWVLSGGASLNCAVLPVELLSFDGYPDDKKVILTWTTASEINNSYFTVEKSADGKHFEPFQIVEGAGTSTVINNYSTVDFSPLPEISYYRLKQTDYDGMISYSEIIVVQSNVTDVFYAIPNPGIDKTKLVFSSSEKGDQNLTVYSMQGFPVFKDKVDADRGINFYELPLQKFEKGIYFIILDDKKSSRKIRFVKL